MAEQNCINKRSGRRCRNFEEAEAEYQTAQSEWEKDINNKKAWDKMWNLINAAVFNSLNKDLEYKLSREIIEERAMDITCNVMSALKNKRAKGKDWKVGKVSSLVHPFCLAKYKADWQNWDQIGFEDSFTYTDEDGNETMMEFEDSAMKGGVYQIHKDLDIYIYGDENDK